MASVPSQFVPITHLSDALQPGLREILVQIGERHLQIEKQLTSLQDSLKDVASLRARAEQELRLFNEREEAWRAKIEEFKHANQAWAIKYKEIDRRRAKLEQ
ncbi:MAG: hypothetical protein Q9180_005392, partial [Flavoplaca navasiana]